MQRELLDALAIALVTPGQTSCVSLWSERKVLVQFLFI